MKLKLLRIGRTEKTRPDLTDGQLYIDDVFFCFTLEDKVREQEGVPVEKWKVKNETAIGRGIYDITLEDSPRFGPDTPTINGVKGFTGVRIHSGNTPGDTEGCVILGFRLTDSGLILPGTTRPAVAELKSRIRQALALKQKVSLQIV